MDGNGRTDGDGRYIGPLWVLEEYQGRGIGTALLKEGMDKSDASGEAIYLEASDDGRPVYESLGFKSVTGGKEMVRRSVVQV
jgi:predicted N-acetyltransferase YhbS